MNLYRVTNGWKSNGNGWKSNTDVHVWVLAENEKQASGLARAAFMAVESNPKYYEQLTVDHITCVTETTWVSTVEG